MWAQISQRTSYKEWKSSRFIGFLIIFCVVYPLFQALNNPLVMYTEKYRQFVPNFTTRVFQFHVFSGLLIFHRQLIIKMLLHGANYLMLLQNINRKTHSPTQILFY